eukprot:scpid104131/ scgid22100/ 
MEACGAACEERVRSCEVDAVVFCVECGTNQCSSCNSALHETSTASAQYASHTRLDLGRVCDVRLCTPVTTAVVTCRDCIGEPRLCSGCDSQRHRADGVRHSHVRVPIGAAAQTVDDGFSTVSLGEDSGPGDNGSSLALLQVQQDVGECVITSRTSTQHYVVEDQQQQRQQQ